MSYNIKIQENKRIAKKCKELKAYNVGASRTYYSMFLQAKQYLEENKFDYDEFLKTKNLNDRIYSHGTIKKALMDCLKGQDKPVKKIFISLQEWDRVYKLRLQADYTKENVLDFDLDFCLNYLETYFSIFNKDTK